MYGIRKYAKLVKVPCFKPAQPAWREGFGWAPTSKELHHLAPLELALKKALEGQRVRFDAEAMDEAFVPLLKVIGDLQGILPYAVDLTQQAISAVFEPVTGEPMALLEVPEDLQKLKEDVRELTVGCGFLEAVPDWIDEFRHLEMLHLDGYTEGIREYNVNNKALPASLGDLYELKHLSVQGFKVLENLLTSISSVVESAALKSVRSPVRFRLKKKKKLHLRFTWI